MTQLADLDFGPSHSWLKTRVGQVIGQSQIENLKAALWPRGRLPLEQPVDLYVNSWQGLGGNAANTRASLLLLLAQLEELAGNADMQPLYIGWTSTGAPSAFTAAEAHDGWYLVTLAQPPYRKYVVTGGTVTAPISVAQVAPAAPASMAVGLRGQQLSSTFSGDSIYLNGAAALVPFPIGATVQAAPATGGTFTRTGGEGAVPVSVFQGASLTTLPATNPVRFVRPGTVAALHTGGVRVFDTMVSGGNAVPTNGTFANANWVQVYGGQHDFAGDCVVTNGLLLLLFQVGQGGAPRLYLWNTQLSGGQWQQLYDLQYLDNALSGGTLREINLRRVGLLWTEVRVLLSTANGNWAQLTIRVFAGSYVAAVEFTPLTQSVTTGLALLLNLANAAKIIYGDTGIQDLTATSGGVVAASAALGYGAAFGTQANGPIYGFVYQNAPAVGQPTGNGTANIGFGDSSGPSQNGSRLYGIFAVPYVTAPNLQAEAESGALGTGWSSVVDAAASAGNAAKAASGTASGNADLFGTAWQPTAGNYDLWFRVRVTSNSGSSAEMTLGLWDPTAAAFVAGASQTFRANQAATTYGWLKINVAAFALPPAGPHNTQFRAVTALTLGTDWFIDEAVVTPNSQGFAAGRAMNFPGDLWAQFAFDLRPRWVVG